MKLLKNLSTIGENNIFFASMDAGTPWSRVKSVKKRGINNSGMLILSRDSKTDGNISKGILDEIEATVNKTLTNITHTIHEISNGFSFVSCPILVVTLFVVIH